MDLLESLSYFFWPGGPSKLCLGGDFEETNDLDEHQAPND
jgi:hypothetical protein